ncbi:MAG TPA: hypothetical protein VFV34_03825 [Blastocatellia bacterium]|nr:hypothetical protein [Blastocatellia bacterium]
MAKEELRFMKPLDQIQPVTGTVPNEQLKAGTAPKTAIKLDPTPIVGTWLNADKATRGIVKVILTEKAGELFVHPFGACSPTPCDWKEVKGAAFSDNVSNHLGLSFTAQFDFGFSSVSLNGELYDGALFLETFTIFKDNSGRFNYRNSEIMYRS